MFGKLVFVQYCRISNNPYISSQDRGFFVLMPRKDGKVMSRILYRIQFNEEKVECRWAFVQNLRIIVFWDKSFRFEFYALYSNGRISTLTPPYPFNQLYTSDNCRLKHEHFAIDSFTARIYLHNDLYNTVPTEAEAVEKTITIHTMLA